MSTPIQSGANGRLTSATEPNPMEWSALDGRSIELAARQIVNLAPHFLNSEAADERVEIQLPRLGLLEIEIPVPAEHWESVRDLASCLDRLDIHSAFIRRLKAQIDQGSAIFQAGFELELDRRLRAHQAVREEIRGYLQAITSSVSQHRNRLSATRVESAGPRPAIAKVTILFLGANSLGSPLELDQEVSKIQGNLKLARERDHLVLKQEWAVTVDSLLQALLDESPTIVHFSGHGKTSGIFLDDRCGGPREVPAEALSDLFRLFRDTVHCVVLNSCYSEHQASAIRQHVPYVIGMRAEIPDSAAIAFSTGFYKAIGAGRDVPFAFDMGEVRMKMEGFEGTTVPILI